MKIPNKRALGYALIILGVIVIFLKPILSITGFAVGEGFAEAAGIWLYAIGLGMIVVGLICVSYESRTPEERIEDIVQKYKRGEIDVVQAGLELNRIDPIQKVSYTTGKKHSIAGTRNVHSIELRAGREAQELAIMEYFLAGRNNPREIYKNSLEISKKASTKHHRKGFEELLDKFIAAYRPRLAAAGIA